MLPIEGIGMLITGGASGLGSETARYFTERGAKVTIAGRRPAKVEAAAAAIGCNGVAGDITVASDRERMVASAVAFAGGRLDALFNNAGNTLRTPIEALNEADALHLFHSNVVGAMMLTGLAVPYLAASAGAVIFVGSVHTRRAFPHASPYAATKGAVEALTKVLAAELGEQGIRVNCVVPGGIVTELNVRAGIFTEAEAVARAETLLASQAIRTVGDGRYIAEAVDYLIRSEWTTGAVLDVDAGLGLGVTRS